MERLDQFAPLAGQAYAQGRNTDFGPNRPGAVSRLEVDVDPHAGFPGRRYRGAVGMGLAGIAPP